MCDVFRTKFRAKWEVYRHKITNQSLVNQTVTNSDVTRPWDGFTFNLLEEFRLKKIDNLDHYSLDCENISEVGSWSD